MIGKLFYRTQPVTDLPVGEARKAYGAAVS